jgi:hypothetical protein
MEQVTNAVPPPLAEKVLGLLIELAGLEATRSPDLSMTDPLAEPSSRKKVGVSGSLVGLSRKICGLADGLPSALAGPEED